MGIVKDEKNGVTYQPFGMMGRVYLVGSQEVQKNIESKEFIYNIVRMGLFFLAVFLILALNVTKSKHFFLLYFPFFLLLADIVFFFFAPRFIARNLQIIGGPRNLKESFMNFYHKISELKELKIKLIKIYYYLFLIFLFGFMFLLILDYFINLAEYLI